MPKASDSARGRQRETERLYALGQAILLSETGLKTSAHAAQHIATIIDEETGRLSLLVTGAVRMSQIGAGKFPLQIRALLESVLRSSESRLEGRPLNLTVDSPEPHRRRRTPPLIVLRKPDVLFPA